jgi:signal transduction histidine kinase
LHDTLLQHIAGLSMMTRSLARRLKGANQPEASTEVEELAQSLRKLGQDLREVTRGLYPADLERDGLMGGLQELCRAVRGTRLARCRFICPEPVLISDPQIALHLYRIAQESVTNAVKHARARTITISLARYSHLMLVVKDDGCGFAPEEVSLGSMGLQMMRYRANVIGAELTVKSRPGAGTSVGCIFSLKTAAAK